MNSRTLVASVIVCGLFGAEAGSSPMPDEARIEARAWFDRGGYVIEEIAALPLTERAARLNHAVYNHCESADNPPNVPMNSLFTECIATCLGYAYVLRGLLEATGAETRYVHLHNIPNQGNHTAVEVRLEDGQWAFFDPTFGAYFVDTQSEEVLSLSEVSISIERARLAEYVRQAGEGDGGLVSATLDYLYSATFDHPYMQLENYLLAEAISFDDPAEMVILDIKLDASRGESVLGSPDAQDFAAAQSAWLSQTNALARDDDPMNDVSFNASMLYNAAEQKLTMISISGLTPGAVYELSLSLFNQTSSDLSFQISPLGRSANYGGERVIALAPGRLQLQEQFRANASLAQFAVRNMVDGSVIHLTAVAVAATSH